LGETSHGAGEYTGYFKDESTSRIQSRCHHEERIHERSKCVGHKVRYGKTRKEEGRISVFPEHGATVMVKKDWVKESCEEETQDHDSSETVIDDLISNRCLKCRVV
jgi:hypothetical protein